jgi:MarR family transcriptional regulator for hemolysin
MTNDSSGITIEDDDQIYGKLIPARTGYPAPDMALTLSIVMVGRRWRALIDDNLRELGHSASRMEAMAAIAYAPPQTTQIQIAKRIGIEGPTLTRTLDMLEADGLVERLPDPMDRRNKLMKLTPAGYEVLSIMFQTTKRLRLNLLKDLPAEEVSMANSLLSTLLERMGGSLEPKPD